MEFFVFNFVCENKCMKKKNRMIKKCMMKTISDTILMFVFLVVVFTDLG